VTSTQKLHVRPGRISPDPPFVSAYVTVCPLAVHENATGLPLESVALCERQATVKPSG